jgi:hypothetical protein
LSEDELWSSAVQAKLKTLFTNTPYHPSTIYGGFDIASLCFFEDFAVPKLWSTDRFEPVLLSSDDIAEMLADAGVPGLVHEP